MAAHNGSTPAGQNGDRPVSTLGKRMREMSDRLAAQPGHEALTQAQIRRQIAESRGGTSR